MRIKLDEPNRYIFHTHCKIRVSDLNYGNHLSNDRLLCFAHQARVEWLESLGYSELNFGGKGIIMTDAAIVYKSEGHLNDELKIEIGLSDLSRSGFDIYYKISNLSNNKDLAMVKTGILSFDYSNKKVCSIQPEVLEKIEQHF
jgi:acyl-CoA thioester hydrolase